MEWGTDALHAPDQNMLLPMDDFLLEPFVSMPTWFDLDPCESLPWEGEAKLPDCVDAYERSTGPRTGDCIISSGPPIPILPVQDSNLGHHINSYSFFLDPNLEHDMVSGDPMAQPNIQDPKSTPFLNDYEDVAAGPFVEESNVYFPPLAVGSDPSSCVVPQIWQSYPAHLAHSGLPDLEMVANANPHLLQVGGYPGLSYEGGEELGNPYMTTSFQYYPDMNINGIQNNLQFLHGYTLKNPPCNVWSNQADPGAVNVGVTPDGGVATRVTKPRRTRAKRGQATDPHSIAERIRREKISERMKNLQELVPNSNKIDKASMLEEIVEYVKFLQQQVKVLCMSRLGGIEAVMPLVTDIQSQVLKNQASTSDLGPELFETQESVAFENEVVKLMDSDVNAASQLLETKGLCLMPITLASAISTRKGSSAAIPPKKSDEMDHTATMYSS